MSYYQDSNPRRQKLIRENVVMRESNKPPLIDTLDKLHEKLQEALIVEHFTIPPYLCALYSIKEGTNAEAANIIKTVAVEEMLHMVLVANLMNALGREPQISAKSLIQGYPKPLPKSSGDFEVGLIKFSKESINTFLRIEKPTKAGALPEIDKFHSIGQFYEAIRESLIWLEGKEKEKGEDKTIFIGKKEKQVPAPEYYGGGGDLFTVSNLDDAEKVLNEIVGQGEGIDGGINVSINEGDELAHYFRFNQIFNERKYAQGDEAKKPPSGEILAVDWDNVYNMEPNPTMDKYSEYPWLLEKMKAFNKNYCRLLDSIHNACNHDPKLMREEGVPLMIRLRTQAVELMKMPSGNGNYAAGPSFEYVP
ncbi:MAG: ferritin-like protein [Ferruginibacter sp.]